MAHWTEDLEDLCGYITDEIAEVNKKLRNAGGKMSTSDISYVDELTHALKSIKSVIAMEEYTDEYSGDYNYEDRRARGGRGRRGGSSYEMRERNTNRDNMGRYTRESYSRDDAIEDMTHDIKNAMPGMPDHLRREAERFLGKLEQDR